MRARTAKRTATRRAGRRPPRCFSRRPEVGEQVGDEAQVLQRPAAGGCGLPGTPVPIDVLVERQCVRHIDDHTVATLLTHPTCLPLVRVPIRWPRFAGFGASNRIGVREAGIEQAEAFRQRSSMMSPSRTTARRSGHARRIRARQAFEHGELPVVVAEFDAADDQPPVPGPQPPETVQVASPRIALEEPPQLRRAVLRPPERLLGCDGVAAPRGPPQLVADAVLGDPPQVGPHGAPALRLEPLEAGEGVAQRLLNDVAGVDRAARRAAAGGPASISAARTGTARTAPRSPPGCPAGPAPGGVDSDDGVKPESDLGSRFNTMTNDESCPKPAWSGNGRDTHDRRPTSFTRAPRAGGLFIARAAAGGKAGCSLFVPRTPYLAARGGMASV